MNIEFYSKGFNKGEILADHMGDGFKKIITMKTMARNAKSSFMSGLMDGFRHRQREIRKDFKSKIIEIKELQKHKEKERIELGKDKGRTH